MNAQPGELVVSRGTEVLGRLLTLTLWLSLSVLVGSARGQLLTLPEGDSVPQRWAVRESARSELRRGDSVELDGVAAVQPQRDSLRNGILIGFVVGFAVGGVFTAVHCRQGISEINDCRRAGWLVVTPGLGAAGAAVGAIVDARWAAFRVPAGRGEPIVEIGVGPRSATLYVNLRNRRGR